MGKHQEITGVKLTVRLLVVTFFVGAISVFFLHEKSAVTQDYRIGIVAPDRGMNDAVKGFIAGMKKYGYEEKRNTTYITRSGKDGLDAALNAMVKKKVDLIFVMTTPITKRAKVITANSKLPVVFIMHDPVASEVIDSLIQPGGNLTGIQVHGDAPKALEWLKIIVPGLKRVFVPIGQKEMASDQSLHDLQNAAAQIGLSIVSEIIKTKEDLEKVLMNMPEDIDAIFALHSVLIMSNIDVVEKIAIKKKMPMMSLHQTKKSTITFGVDGYSAGIQVSRLANQILQGEKPAGIPTELADYYLGINLQNAQYIGLPISAEILLQADNIIR